MKTTILLENYTEGLASGGKSRHIYERFAQEYLNYSDGDFSREMINKYINQLVIKGTNIKFSDGSANFAFRVIRTLYNRNETALKEDGFTWPFRRGESPQIREDRINAPALHPTTVARMIASVRAEGLPEHKAFLALSTTYGLRRTEMVELAGKDIRLKDQTIHIATAKHGRERTHLIPPEIVPFLKGYDFGPGRSDNFVFSLWYQLEHLIKLSHIEQVGWHSVRRTVNTMLLKKLPESTVMSYLRWKQRTSSHMPYRYSAQRFVGEEEETTEVVGDALDVDNEVFREHPFLEHWR